MMELTIGDNARLHEVEKELGVLSTKIFNMPRCKERQALRTKYESLYVERKKLVDRIARREATTEGGANG